jgi:cystathionine beta-lyase
LRTCGPGRTRRTLRGVHFPGLPDHPGRELHRRQAAGPGPLVSFETGDAELSRRLVDGLRLFAIAVSFGSVASAATLPCRMSHASVPPELRGRLGPPSDLVRLAVGLEDVDDLLEDLDQALAGAAGGVRRVAGAGG